MADSKLVKYHFEVYCPFNFMTTSWPAVCMLNAPGRFPATIIAIYSHDVLIILSVVTYIYSGKPLIIQPQWSTEELMQTKGGHVGGVCGEPPSL